MSDRDQSAVDDAVEVAAAVAEGKISLLQACRTIVALQHQLEPVPEEILDPIRGVASELDDIPDEACAPYWNPEAFEQKLRERDEYLERVAPILLKCFRELREYFEQGSRSGTQR